METKDQSTRTPKTRTVLSVDFDFFFPTPEPEEPNAIFLFDWGHSEDRAIFYNAIWPPRAAAFLREGLELPGTSGEEANFWDRFTFSDNATLYSAESHSCIVPHLPGTEFVLNVLNYDAHHDAGYNRGKFKRGHRLTCDNWAAHLAADGVNVKTIYPAWKPHAFQEEPSPRVTIERCIDDGAAVKAVIDAVFVCRSGVWVPPWLDGDFCDFMARCPVQRRRIVGPFISNGKRPWDMAEVYRINRDFEESWARRPTEWRTA